MCGIGVTISGCQVAIGALDAAGHLGAFDTSGSSSSSLLLGTETERHNIGKYEVGISLGFYKNNPGVIFMAYNQGMRTNFVYFEKNDTDDMKMVNDFNKMDEMGKKKQIRDWFIKYAKIDLGPAESETAEKSPTTPSVPAPNL